MNGSFGNYAIIVEVGDGAAQRIDAMHGVVSQGLGLRGLLSGSLGLLLDFGSLLVHLLETSQRTGIHVLDVL